MPKNRLIYLGVLVVAASAILYVLFQFTKFVQPVLPWVGGAGILAIVLGVFLEAKASKAAKQMGGDLKPGKSKAESIGETKL